MKMLKLITKVGNAIWTGSISMLVVGGAVVVLGGCYRLGKEIEEDIETLQMARKAARKEKEKEE